jgi:uncharacterized repeat protein (TIGR03943 family)
MSADHVHGPDCGHEHVHGPDCNHDPAGHDHAGHGHTAGEYYVEQLMTIAISGAFAVVGVMMYTSGKLQHILAPELRPWVLWGGVALFGLTLVRVAVLWRMTGKAADCGHDHGHAHGPDCGHDHGPDGHHDHGSFYWRGVVLAFPIALFVLGFPNEGFSQQHKDRMLGKDQELGNVADVADKSGNELSMTFVDLADAAEVPDLRTELEGRTARLKGQLKRISDKEFTLYYLKTNCCAADMIPLKARILSDTSISAFPNDQWIEVSGKLQFAQVPGKNQYMPVLRTQVKNIAKIPPQQ